MRSGTSPLRDQLFRSIGRIKSIVSGENINWNPASSNCPKWLDQPALQLPRNKLPFASYGRSRNYSLSKLLGKHFEDNLLKVGFSQLDKDRQGSPGGNIENNVVSSLIKSPKCFEDQSSSICTNNSNKTILTNFENKSRSFDKQQPGIFYNHNEDFKSDTTGSSVKLLEESLREKLLARPTIKIYDHMAPTPSYLLKMSLKSYLPFVKSCTDKELVNKGKFSLPPGHHLVYFHQVATGNLLPDGTDDLHSPGFPFERRLWVGGSFEFTRTITLFPKIQMLCMEKITDVRVTGICGDEKVFVDITREIINPYLDSVELKEVRTLVFMRRSKFKEFAERKIAPKRELESFRQVL